MCDTALAVRDIFTYNVTCYAMPSFIKRFDIPASGTDLGANEIRCVTNDYIILDDSGKLLVYSTSNGTLLQSFNCSSSQVLPFGNILLVEYIFSLYLVNITTGTLVQVPVPTQVNCATIANKYIYLAGNTDATIFKLDYQGNVLAKLRNHTAEVSALAAGRSFLYSIGRDATVCMWDYETDSCHCSIPVGKTKYFFNVQTFK